MALYLCGIDRLGPDEPRDYTRRILVTLPADSAAEAAREAARLLGWADPLPPGWREYAAAARIGPAAAWEAIRRHEAEG
jgi:hypothetical protein